MTGAPVLPRFLVIGAPRSGTTTLYHGLRGHPEIYLKPEKAPEPHYFLDDRRYAEGPEAYAEAALGGWSGEPMPGAAATSTLFSEKAARRVAADLEDPRVLCLLRDPVERMFSEWAVSVDRGWEELSFAEAVEREPDRLADPPDHYHATFEPNAYVKRGHYVVHLAKWRRHLPDDRIGVFLFDDLAADPAGLLERVLAFLGLDPHPEARPPDRALNRSSRSRRSMDPDFETRLRERFREPNRKLGALLGRDLSHWEAVGSG